MFIWWDRWNMLNVLCNDHDDVIKRRPFPHYCPFVRGIHRSPVNSSHKVQWRGALMFVCFICTWINGWVNNREAGYLRRHRAHYGVTNECSIFQLLLSLSSKGIVAPPGVCNDFTKRVCGRQPERKSAFHFSTFATRTLTRSTMTRGTDILVWNMTCNAECSDIQFR